MINVDATIYDRTTTYCFFDIQTSITAAEG